MKRIAGLDQLRFILALCVLLPHCHLVPDFSGQPRGSLIELAFRLFANNLINPVAAVIVFFVISGFCIHLPYRNEGRIELLPYFTRRFVRILIPMAAALLLAKPLDLKLPLFSDSILWSLVCEEVYYVLYPGLRKLAARFTWRNLFVFAFIISFTLGLFSLRTNDITKGVYPAYGASLTWLVGLPCWLLGCLLAERYESFTRVVTSPQIWSWRLVVWATAWTCSVLKFHSPLGYPVTLNFFAVLAFFWIQREIAYYKHKQPLRLLENGGAWSYSIYLIHLHAQAIFLFIGLPALVLPLRWTIHLSFLLILCYAFYLVIERPSHRLARRLSRSLSGKLKYGSVAPLPALSDAGTGAD
jgi:peptidoglycan/LPS O-acetylase OafA/YrhL